MMKSLVRARFLAGTVITVRLFHGVRPTRPGLVCLAVGNGEDPGRGFARCPERPSRLPNHHHDVVKYLFDQVGTLEKRRQKSRETGLISAIQPFERLQIAPRNTS